MYVFWEIIENYLVMKSLEELPDVALERILFFADFRTKLNLRFASRRFFYFQNHDKLWESGLVESYCFQFFKYIFSTEFKKM